MSIKTSAELPFEPNLRAKLLPLLLAMLAVTTIEAAQFDPGTSRGRVVWKIALIALAVVAASRLLSRHGTVVRGQPHTIAGLLIGLSLWPLVTELFQMLVWHTSNPLEILLVSVFRNLACGLAVVSSQRMYDRLCCVVSMFLMIFSSAMTADPFVHGMVVVFAVIGVWWLMGTYWDSLQCHLIGATERRFPKRVLISIPVLLLLLLGTAPWAAPQVATALPGWMPSSGGDRWSNPNARSGLNNGEALVPASQDARSFGPVESEIFLESTQPSLYDIFNDTYGSPPQIQKTDRSIGLPPELLRHTHHRMAEQRKLGRQFSTARQARPQQLKEQQDVDGNALLFVGGRTPLHLRLEVFDLFDGVEWFPEVTSANLAKLSLEWIDEQPWVRSSGGGGSEIWNRAEPHQLKIINLETNRIPTPAGILGVHIDKVDRADMFNWAQEGVLKMEREALPDLTVIHLRSRTSRQQGLLREGLTFSSGQLLHRQIPNQISKARLADLAKSWSTGASGDWPRVQAVVHQLRSQFTLDKDYRSPTGCEDTVSDFLFGSRRGPDYMFASAAAMLLRHMGFSTRVVSGFYANPGNFDQTSCHTPIQRDDVHFWVEVYAGSGNWITVEPSPGYEVLQPPPGIWEQCAKIAGVVGNHIWLRAYAYLGALLMLVVAWQWWIELYDFVATCLWNTVLATPPREQIRRTLDLLMRRCRLAGTPRPPGATATRWLRDLSVVQAEYDRDILRRFIVAADWAVYSSESQTLIAMDTREVCRKIVADWTLSRLKQLKHQSDLAARLK